MWPFSTLKVLYLEAQQNISLLIQARKDILINGRNVTLKEETAGKATRTETMSG